MNYITDASTSQADSSQTVYTKEQVDQLLEEFRRKLEIERSSRDGGANLPMTITEELETSSSATLQENLRNFRRGGYRYALDKWTTPETINRTFLQDIKKQQVDTAQVIYTIYKITEGTRVQAKFAAELFE
ncbi:hypothetical protein BDB01DRAFT_887007 [Pilobolus umbonatus]|nr:hypothetical protein BDB01DRAFT_887007 [Pilobolus umbonatus]